MGVYGRSANKSLGGLEGVAELFPDLGQDHLGLGHDFRADAVAGHDNNIFNHLLRRSFKSSVTYGRQTVYYT